MARRPVALSRARTPQEYTGSSDLGGIKLVAQLFWLSQKIMCTKKHRAIRQVEQLEFLATPIYRGGHIANVETVGSSPTFEKLFTGNFFTFIRK